MQSIIEDTTMNRAAPAIIFKNQKYQKRCSNKDGSESWVCCNKTCRISLLLDKGLIRRYPEERSHGEESCQQSTKCHSLFFFITLVIHLDLVDDYNVIRYQIKLVSLLILLHINIRSNAKIQTVAFSNPYEKKFLI